MNVFRLIVTTLLFLQFTVLNAQNARFGDVNKRLEAYLSELRYTYDKAPNGSLYKKGEVVVNFVPNATAQQIAAFENCIADSAKRIFDYTLVVTDRCVCGTIVTYLFMKDGQPINDVGGLLGGNPKPIPPTPYGGLSGGGIVATSSLNYIGSTYDFNAQTTAAATPLTSTSSLPNFIPNNTKLIGAVVDGGFDYWHSANLNRISYNPLEFQGDFNKNCEDKDIIGYNFCQ